MQSIIEWLEASAARHGDRVAVEDGSGSITFMELRRSALKIAAAINASEPQTRYAAIYLPKSIDALSAMMGTLYSGRAYAPLDCRGPVHRAASIIESLSPAIILTSGKWREKIQAGIGSTCQVLDISCSLPELGDPEVLAARTLSSAVDADPAYILFTSGSTGTPKGVVIPHRRVMNYINWALSQFGASEGTVIGNQSPFYFTVSVMDIFTCLAAGAKLCLIPENLFTCPDKLLAYLDGRKISRIFWVSSVYHHIAKSTALDGSSLRHLRDAWFVGEPLALSSLRYWMKRLPHVHFANMYGATETDMTLFHAFPPGEVPNAVPLGKPCANTGAFLLNEYGGLCGVGEIGEIYIRGPALALGYFMSPEMTLESFHQNPLHKDYPDTVYKTGDMAERSKDGAFTFHGQRDWQFKRLGYRIEAGEVECAAEGCPFVQEACALYDQNVEQIVLFYQACGGCDETALRKHLMQTLPLYMLPSRLVRIGAVPHNANGKKDRLSLKKELIPSINP